MAKKITTCLKFLNFGELLDLEKADSLDKVMAVLEKADKRIQSFMDRAKAQLEAKHRGN